ncbi:MAG: Na+/H+ antiporter NhaC family protein [Candidatus Babeliales bacterium]
MDEYKNKKGSLTALLLPLLLLPLGVIIGILISGSYRLFGGNASLLEAFKNNNQTFLVMCLVGVGTFIISYGYSFIQKQVLVHDLLKIIGGGIGLMYNAILMVMLATILGVFLRENLMTGNYLASLLLNTMPIVLLPVMIFITSLIITLSTGSAWGTFALMIPIVIQMLMSLFQITPPIEPQTIGILFPALGAILSGAVCGDQISPFSETTIMTATSTGIKPFEHFYTQLPYALPAMMGSILAFLLSGLLGAYSFWFNITVSLGTSLMFCLMVLYSFNKNK